MQHLYKLLFFCLLMPNIGLAQMNLVPNPSFEDTTGCPQWLGDFFAESWQSPTYGSPDFFHTCSTGQLGVPQNVFGWQQPRTGLAYAGGHASDFSGASGREYIQCRLNQPLEVGEKYEVSFWISRADSATKACDNIGAYFSSMPVSALNAYNLPFLPQVISQPNSPVTDATDWIQVIDTFTAVGGEEYLTIGIFTDDANTNWIPTLVGFFPEPYYYIDDVSVEKVLVSSVNEILRKEISVFPNPTVDFIDINFPSLTGSYTVSVYDVSGRQILQISDISQSTKRLDVSQAKPGLLLVRIEHNNQSYQYKIVKQ